MQKHEANIYAIAEEAGVSIATVSRVINNHPSVTEKSRNRVLEAIKKLNYVPNSVARSLSTSVSNLVGVVIPDINNPFFSLILKGLTRMADEKGQNIFLFNTDESVQREHRVLQSLREHRLCGIIITPVSASDQETPRRLREFEGLGIPVVLLDREFQNAEFDRVVSDDMEGSFLAVCELIRLGHRRIAIITGPGDSRPGHERMNGYIRALTEHAIPLRQEYIREGNFMVDRAYEQTLALCRMDEPPTAIFASNNMTTYGCLKAFGELGLRVGQDIALISFDEIEALRWLNYSVSVVNRDVMGMGEQAMRLLNRRIESDNVQGERLRVCLPTELLLRGSERFVGAIQE